MDPIDLNYAPAAYSAYQQQSPNPLLSSTTMGQTPSVAAPGGFGLNMDTARLGVAGIGTIGNLWMAYQAQQLANKQFDYTKDVTDQNVANQIKSYNTTLSDKIRSRVFTEGGTQQEADKYLQKNRLQRQY